MISASACGPPIFPVNGSVLDIDIFVGLQLSVNAASPANSASLNRPARRRFLESIREDRARHGWQVHALGACPIIFNWSANHPVAIWSQV
jgi:hypothetical protein